MLTTDERVEDQTVERGDDRRRRFGADTARRERDETLARPHQRRAQRRISRCHEEELVARQGDGAARSEPVAQGCGDGGGGAVSIADGDRDVALAEVVEEGADEAVATPEVMAHRAVWECRGILDGAHGQRVGAGAPEEIEGTVEYAGS